MVKGTNKRVIVVQSPDPQMFEEAIFIVRDDYARKSGSDRQVMEQVRRAATEYCRKASGTKRTTWRRLRTFLLAASGAILAACGWLLFYFFGS